MSANVRPPFFTIVSSIAARLPLLSPLQSVELLSPLESVELLSTLVEEAAARESSPFAAPLLQMLESVSMSENRVTGTLKMLCLYLLRQNCLHLTF